MEHLSVQLVITFWGVRGSWPVGLLMIGGSTSVGTSQEEQLE